MATENKIPEIIRSSMENIRSMVDANTVVGDPIVTANGTTIIPISKISVGIASGGLDYNPKKEAAPRPQNFGGGGGTGISVAPVGFLAVKPDGQIEMIELGKKTPSDPIGQLADLIDRSPDILARLRDVFTNFGKKKDAEEEPKETEEIAE